MVVTDVDGAEIPILVDEEVDNVDCVEGGADENGLGYKTVELILISDEREVAKPDISQRKEKGSIFVRSRCPARSL